MKLYKDLVKVNLAVFLLVLSVLLGTSSGVLMVTPNTTDGVLTVCPGEEISITCEHDNVAGDATRWVVTGTGDSEVDCSVPADHLNPMNIFTCGVFTLSMVSDDSGPTLSSTATTTATSRLDGAVVECFNSFSPSNLVGNFSINVLAIPTPTIESVWQTSQSTVRVNMSVSDTQCVGTYVATATQQTGTGSAQGNSTSSTVEITGLDVCSYDYNITGNVLSLVGDINGNLSMPFDFTANLSGLNLGVSNVMTSDRTMIEWVEGSNSDYLTCIINYLISYSGESFNITFPATSVNRETLQQNNFTFCEPVSVTVTPLTPRGPLSGGASTGQVSLIIPGFEAPMLSGVPTQNRMANESIMFNGRIQNISSAIVTDQMYGVELSSLNCTPNVSFNGDTFVASLPNSAMMGDMYTVCVSFQNGDCMAMNSTVITVTGPEIRTVGTPDVTDTTFSATFALPITAYLPSQLLLLISVVPSETAPVETPFPTDYTYTLVLPGLSPETTYNYTVQIVLSSNMSQIVAPIFTGSFTTDPTPTTQPPTTPTTMTDAETTGSPVSQTDTLPIIVAVIVVFLVVIIVLALIAGVLIYLYCKKKTGSMKVTSHELRHSLAETGPTDEVRGSPPMEEPQSTATFTNPDSVRNPSPPAEGAEGGAKVEAVIYADLDITTKNRAQRKEPEKPSVDDHEAVQYSTVSFATHKTEEPKMDEPAASES